MAVSVTGVVAAQATVPFEASTPALQPTWHEQDPRLWWAAVCQAISRLTSDLKTAGIRSEQLRAVAVDGTSGTLVALDARGEPLRPAILYNDGRAAAEANELNALAGSFCDKLGYRFAASFALAKILWLRAHEPGSFGRTARFVHQADYVLGQLSGRRDVSDYSNALKTGYDLVDERWPEWLTRLSSVAERLPEVVAPGTPVGNVTTVAAEKTGLPAGLTVVAGASDGTAACLASGLKRPGDYNTTLGTTLVFKGISGRICRHPDGVLYCHKLPGGVWLPGAASNTGCEWIHHWFAGVDPTVMDTAVEAWLPSRCVAYPLARHGERFPMLSPAAEGFCMPETEVAIERYAACLQGVALVERMGYAVLDEVTGTRGGDVYSTGGGSRSDVWMQCRADVTGRVLHRPACPESAFAAAVLAALGSGFGSLAEATEAMVKLQRSFLPHGSTKSRYDELFQQFLEQIERRGYL